MNITYYFGAGASRNALPIVKEINNKLLEFVNEISQVNLTLSDNEYFEGYVELVESKKELQDQLINHTNWVSESIKSHASFDTFAKKLWIKQDIYSLKVLKGVISSFFTWEQIFKPFDNRYDSFFASILGPSAHVYPKNLRIISWNYDFQFEYSINEFTEDNNYQKIKDNLNIISKHETVRNENEVNRFSIFKINGSAIFLSSVKPYGIIYADPFDKANKMNTLENIVRNFSLLIKDDKIKSGLSFAWENESSQQNIVNLIKCSTKETDVLVVIGYSFPFFNRDVDRQIINNMQKLQKVYFQAPDPESLRERFLAIRSDIHESQLVLRYDTEQFLIPNEM